MPPRYLNTRQIVRCCKGRSRYKKVKRLYLQNGGSKMYDYRFFWVLNAGYYINQIGRAYLIRLYGEIDYEN